MINRCGYCGELWHSTIAAGEQYRCGSIVCDGEVTRHRYCRRLCGEPGHKGVWKPRMKVDKPPAPKKCVGTNSQWRGVRDILRAMGLGQTVQFDGINVNSAHKAYRYFAHEIPHRVMFRREAGGCVASTVGDIRDMRPGESRLYTDNLRHLMRRLLTLNTGALSGRSGEAYSFDLVDGVYWIRRVK